MSDEVTFSMPRHITQEVGDDIRIVRLSDIAWIPIELGEISFVLLGRDTLEEPRRTQVAIVADALPMLEPRKVFLVDWQHPNPWVRGVLDAAEALRRKENEDALRRISDAS